MRFGDCCLSIRRFLESLDSMWQQALGFLKLSDMVIAELSILVSFLCFLAFFIKKAWPVLMSKLDDHIEKVKNQIDSAERLKEESAVALSRANVNSVNIQNEVEKYKRRSEERIAQLEKESLRHIQILREEATLSLNAQLNAELSKHKEILLDKLADLITKKLESKMTGESREIDFSKEDLRKLVN